MSSTLADLMRETSTTMTVPSREPYTILGMSKSRSFKELCNAYKSFVRRCQSLGRSSNKDETRLPNKSPKITDVDTSKATTDQNVTEKPNQAPIVQSPPPAVTSNHLRKTTDEGFFSRPLVLLKKLSRKSISSNNYNFNAPAAIPTIPSPSRTGDTARSPTANNNATITESPCSSARTSYNHTTRRNLAPMVFTQSRSLHLPMKKAPPIEMTLECTLEELFHGRVKRIRITRHIINVNGVFVPEEETLKIKLMPGWKAGTRITFEGKGDERLGYLSADVVFVVSEKPHHLFSRDGDNLVYETEVSLTEALAGCTLSVPLFGRENMWLSFADDEVICPGYEKVIRGQGMPVTDENGKKGKGDFVIRFTVGFPAGLSDERRSEACRILRDCCYS